MSNDIHDQTTSTAAAAQNTHHHDKAKDKSNTADAFSKMLDGFRSNGVVDIDGGEGDDVINAKGEFVHVNGGAGDDVINVESTPHYHPPHFVTLHEIQHMREIHRHIQAHHHDHHDHHGHHGFGMRPGVIGTGGGHMDRTPASLVSGGDGNDKITTNGVTLARGGSGDDTMDIGGGTAYGGTGNDTITNKGSADLYGGAGDDVIRSVGMMNINSNISGGAGDDEIMASGSQLSVDGGTGNDKITLDGEHQHDLLRPNVVFDHHGHHVHLGHGPESGSAVLKGGMGDDAITITNEATATIEYFKGDGHDTLSGANEASVLKLGQGLTFEGTTFVVDGNNLAISFPDAEGSVTILDYATQGVPMVAFASGRTLDASTTIALAGGNPDAYKADDGAAAKSSAPSDHDD